MIGYIYTGARNIFNSFSFNGPTRGNNALATVKDLQNVIWGINNQIRYRPIDFMLTGNGASDPTFKYLMSGQGNATECQGSCTCSTNECGCNGPVNDPGACQKDAFTLFVAPTWISTGRYVMTFDPVHPDMVNRGIGVFVSAPKNPDEVVTVSKMVQNRITISTYVAGVLSDNVLDETVFQMRVYVKNK
jgi:hypothetical protein